MSPRASRVTLKPNTHDAAVHIYPADSIAPEDGGRLQERVTLQVGNNPIAGVTVLTRAEAEIIAQALLVWSRT